MKICRGSTVRDQDLDRSFDLCHVIVIDQVGLRKIFIIMLKIENIQIFIYFEFCTEINAQDLIVI